MAIAATMNLNNQEDIAFINSLCSNTTPSNNNNNVKDKQQEGYPLPPYHQVATDQDEHEHDLVMPGFRFYPTEEELIEFYLRRKVEGKRFNVELITFLDLYRYDPWQLPALAAMGDQEWFFYVPRDRKYRNGDRPNRVTTSGYWKATGADRMIRAENKRAIGLKKTLVFYTGKAPKGIRTSWIMNEYRLPQPQTQRYLALKAEISLCRVYKRAGVEDHPSVPRGIPLSGKKTFHPHHHHQTEATVSPVAAQQHSLAPPPPQTPPVVVDRMAHIRMDHHQTMKKQEEEGIQRNGGNGVIPLLPSSTFMGNSSCSPHHHHHHHGDQYHDHRHSHHHDQHHQQPNMDEIHRLVEHQQALLSPQQQLLQFQALSSNNQGSSTTTITTPNSHFLFSNYLFSPSTTLLPPSSMAASGGSGGGGVTFSERLWEWNPLPEPN